MTRGRPPGSKTRELLPGEVRPARKPYVSLIRKKPVRKVPTSIHLRNNTIEEIKQVAIDRNTTTSVGGLLEWLSAYNDADGNTFQLAGTSKKFVRLYRCNRGTAEVHNENPKAATIGRNTECPAILKAWCFEEPRRDSAEVFVVREGTHNHESQHQFTRMSQYTRFGMEDNLLKGASVTHLLLQQARSCGMDAQSPEESLASLSNANLPRSKRLSRAELYRIQNGLTKRQYQLDPDQDKSVELWCTQRLRERLLYKQNAVQTDFGVETIPFQMAFQSWLAVGLMQGASDAHPGDYLQNSVVSIDATHNLSKNRKILLYTVAARTKDGHACPIAYLLTTGKSEEVVYKWLNALHEKYPNWCPAKVMTDCDLAQINAIRRVFSVPYELCTWHVLRNWRKKSGSTKVSSDVNGVVSTAFVDHHLYVHMSRLLKEKEYSVFAANLRSLRHHLQAISITGSVKDRDVARYFLDHYLCKTSTWSPRSWAHAYRDVSVTATHTTMLSEAWHHVLKYTLLRRRSNHRVDLLLWTLTSDVPTYYSSKLWFEFNGGERGTRLTKKSKALAHAQRASHLIPGSSITWISVSQCRVPSQKPSMQHLTYLVSIAPGAELRGCFCDCPFFRFNHSAGLQCKHIYAAIRSLAEGDNEFIPVGPASDQTGATAGVVAETRSILHGGDSGIDVSDDEEEEAPHNRHWSAVRLLDAGLVADDDPEVYVQLVDGVGQTLATPAPRPILPASTSWSREISMSPVVSSSTQRYGVVSKASDELGDSPGRFRALGSLASLSPLNVKNNSKKRPSKTYETMGRSRNRPICLDQTAGMDSD